MAGRPCGACSLPIVLRHQIVERRRRFVPLRTLSSELREAGYPLSKDALFRHFETCVPASLVEPDLSEAASGSGVAVATAAAEVLDLWPSLARRLGERLYQDGACEEALIVVSRMSERQRPDFGASPRLNEKEMLQ